MDAPYGFSAPRPHPRRLQVEAYPITSQAETRFGDMDVNGHLNNLALEELHEDTRARMNRRVFADVYRSRRRDARIVTAQNVVHFLAEAFWPATITTAIGADRIGRTSWVVCSALFVDGTCVTTCDTTLVLLGADGPTPIPEAARATLADLVLRPA
jgi:acyl-CoA thioester hydrolase